MVDWRVPVANDANANVWVANVVVPEGEKVVLEWTDYMAFHNVYRAVPSNSTPSALRLLDGVTAPESSALIHLRDDPVTRLSNGSAAADAVVLPSQAGR